MDALFPRMYDRPEGRAAGIGGSYWLISLVMLPSILLFLMSAVDPLWGADVVAWTMALYCGINFAAMIATFRSYLSDSFLNVRLELRKFIHTVAIAAAVLLVVLLSLVSIGSIYNVRAIWQNISYVFPISELPVKFSGALVFYQQPLLGFVCLVVLVPVTMSCMYYAVFFAPICVERPWLAYLVVALVSALPRIVDLANVGTFTDHLSLYVLQLPWHMIACWSYQKSDTIWAPIAVYGLVNLAACLFLSVLWFL